MQRIIRRKDVALVLSGAGLVAGALWLRFFLDDGLADWKTALCYGLVFAGALVSVQGGCRIWLADRLAASKAPGLYMLVRGMICASLLISASGLYRMWRYQEALSHGAVESRGVITGQARKGKRRELFQQYRFQYNDRFFRGEFADPAQRFHTDDAVRILHGAGQPQYNQPLPPAAQPG